MIALKLNLLLLPFSGILFWQSGSIKPLPAPVPFPEGLESDFLREEGALSRDYQQTIEYAGGDREFTVSWRERQPNQSVLLPWINAELKVGLDYRVTDIAFGSGGNDIYVAGMRDNGSGVIKRFSFSPRANGLSIRSVPVSVEPIGTPMPTHQVEVVLNGSSWSPPLPGSHGTPSRTQILGDAVGLVRCLEVDPYGRFLVLLSDEDSKLHLLDLTAMPNTLQLLSDPTTVPELADVDNMVMLTKNAGGHVILLHDRAIGGTAQVVMIDNNNDAQFESIAAIPNGEAGLSAAGVGYSNVSEVWSVDDLPGDW